MGNHDQLPWANILQKKDLIQGQDLEDIWER